MRKITINIPGGSDGKESACNAGDLGSIPGSGRSPGGAHGNPLQYSWLENSMDREPGGLQSMGSQRVRHDWVTNTFTFNFHSQFVSPTTHMSISQQPCGVSGCHIGQHSSNLGMCPYRQLNYMLPCELSMSPFPPKEKLIIAYPPELSSDCPPTLRLSWSTQKESENSPLLWTCRALSLDLLNGNHYSSLCIIDVSFYYCLHSPIFGLTQNCVKNSSLKIFSAWITQSDLWRNIKKKQA